MNRLGLWLLERRELVDRNVHQAQRIERLVTGWAKSNEMVTRLRDDLAQARRDVELLALMTRDPRGAVSVIATAHWIDRLEEADG